MNKDNLAFLLAGLAFGVLIGAGVINAVNHAPDVAGTAHTEASGAGPAAPAGPPSAAAPGAAAAGASAAPMMAEIRELRQRIKDDPKDFEALVRLANVYHDVSMFDDAIGFYERGLEIQPGNPNLLTDLGICYRGKGEFDRALSLFAEAFEKDPQHWQSLFNRAIVTGFDLKRFDEAEATLALMEPLAPAQRIQELRQALEQARSREAGGGSAS